MRSRTSAGRLRREARAQLVGEDELGDDENDFVGRRVALFWFFLAIIDQAS